MPDKGVEAESDRHFRVRNDDFRGWWVPLERVLHRVLVVPRRQAAEGHQEEILVPSRGRPLDQQYAHFPHKSKLNRRFLHAVGRALAGDNAKKAQADR